MQRSRVRHGLLAIATGFILTAASMAAAQDNPRIVPQPRPLTAEVAPPTPEAPTLVPQNPVPAQEEAAPPAAEIASGPPVGSVTGFPIPRFVSIKANEANARRGPSRSHRIDWVFQRRHMPVMVVAEHGQWRRIIDRDGAGGWVHHTLLSGNRTVIVDAESLPILARPGHDGMVRAQAERDVIGELRRCSAGWCEIDVGGFRGWVDASGLWGVDPGEELD